MIPILLDAIDLRGTPLAGLNPLPSNGLAVRHWASRSEAFVDIARGVRVAAEAILRKTTPAHRLVLRA